MAHNLCTKEHSEKIKMRCIICKSMLTPEGVKAVLRHKIPVSEALCWGHYRQVRAALGAASSSLSRRTKIDEKIKAGELFKCRTCNEELPYTAFVKCKQNYSGIKYICRDCNKEKVREYRKRRRTEDTDLAYYVEKTFEAFSNMDRICSTCKEDYPHTAEYFKDTDTSTCIACEKGE